MRRIAPRREDGFTLPLVAMIMTVIGMLAGVALLAAQTTNSGANEDRRWKRALAAAEAGMQEAAFRLTTLRPDATKCLADAATAYVATPINGECTIPVTGSVAPGAAYSYRATPRLPTGASCADGPATAPDASASDHCVTSTGTVGGVSRRVQARVRVPRSSIFGTIGLLGLERVTMFNSDKVFSDVGSNGAVTGGNSVQVSGSVVIPQSAPAPAISGSNPPVVRQPDPWGLAAVDYAPSFTTNNNSSLSGWGSRYNSTNRTVRLDNSVEYTMANGTYNLCDFYADNSVKIKAPSTSARIQIYIDSPDRPGSNCAAGTGRFCLDNSVEFNKDPGHSAQAARFEIYVYGSSARCSDGSPPGLAFDGTQITGLPAHTAVALNNSVEFHGTIYAPTTKVLLTNSIKMWGGIASQAIDLGNSVEFTHPNSVQNQQPATGDIRRLSWVECKPAPTTPADPESGCS